MASYLLGSNSRMGWFCGCLAKLTCLAGLAGFVGCDSQEAPPSAKAVAPSPAAVVDESKLRPPKGMSVEDARIFRTNVSEDLILELTPKFRLLSDRLKGNSVDLTPLFLDQVECAGLGDFDFIAAFSKEKDNSNTLVSHLKWPLNESTSNSENPIDPSDVWKPLFDASTGVQFEDTSFGFLQGKILDDKDVFRTIVSFEGRFRDDQQGIYSVKAKQTLDWIPVGEGDWKIKKWHQDSFKLAATDSFLFENVTKQAVPEESAIEILTTSLHYRKLLEKMVGKTVLAKADDKYPYFSDWEGSYHYPAVSVVDLDSDGWDDLFVVDRWGETILLRNKGDGTFTDVTDSVGLKLNPAFANCALFF